MKHGPNSSPWSLCRAVFAVLWVCLMVVGCRSGSPEEPLTTAAGASRPTPAQPSVPKPDAASPERQPTSLERPKPPTTTTAPTPSSPELPRRLSQKPEALLVGTWIGDHVEQGPQETREAATVLARSTWITFTSTTMTTTLEPLGERLETYRIT
ncbi:MAG: hypothetical protein AAFS10_02995, partial [Myxococcota bacterium]